MSFPTISSKVWSIHKLDDLRRKIRAVGRSSRKLTDPDLGVLAAQLMFGLQRELFRRTAEAGFDDLRPRHGAVLAYLDEEGIRLADLARIAGRNKQTIAAIVDELATLGYFRRVDDRTDRRAKLIVPTERGRQRMRLGDEIVAEIECHHQATLGDAAYGKFKQALRAIAADQVVVADEAE
jgi:DNA-binding MarR family transcriptional regulator